MFALLLSLFSFIGFQQSDSVYIESEIEQVTVFQNQAQIQRVAETNIPLGTSTIIFTDLSESLIDQSVQLQGNGAYTLLSLTVRNDFTERTIWRDDVEQLRIQRDSLNERRKVKQAELQVIQKEIDLLDATRNIITEHKLNSSELNNLLSVYRTNLGTALSNQIALNNDIEDLNEQINLLNQRIRESGQVERSQFKEVVAEVQSNSSQTIIYTLDYLVNNAGWEPSYDLHSSDINSPLEITYKAKVYQNTGHDWEEVKFIINSGDPSSNALKPELMPGYVGYYNPNSVRSAGNSTSAVLQRNNQSGIISGQVVDAESRESLPGTNILIEGTNLGASTDRNGNFELPYLSNGSYVLRVAFIGFLTQRIPVTINNNGYDVQITMEVDIVGLDEVVVAGFSSRVSGVSLRGTSDINTQAPPLYVINGIISDEDQVSDLDPEFIESVETLRGSEATELYGSRATNGVIVVTTRNNVLAEIQQNQTSFSYEISIPYSVPSDGKQYTVEIKREKPATEYSYGTVPKLSANAYLESNLPNWSELKLIKGQANIYFENRFVGTTFIDPISVEDTLSVSLGKDEQIVVNRQKLQDVSSKNFFRNRTRENNVYEISIRNTKSEAITITVEDQIPVTTNDEIKVSVRELSNGSLDEETGIVTWKLELAPGETTSLRLGFEIEYPRGRRIVY